MRFNEHENALVARAKDTQKESELSEAELASVTGCEMAQRHDPYN